ncbi:hypothetical protein ACS0TY_034504 [Phlomoides rotata]
MKAVHIRSGRTKNERNHNRTMNEIIPMFHTTWRKGSTRQSDLSRYFMHSGTKKVNSENSPSNYRT